MVLRDFFAVIVDRGGGIHVFDTYQEPWRRRIEMMNLDIEGPKDIANQIFKTLLASSNFTGILVRPQEEP